MTNQTLAAPARSLENGQTPCVVVDTNAVLDWLVFADPAAAALGAAICAGALRWIGTEAIAEEATEVLGRLLTHPPLTRWRDRHATATEALGRWLQKVPAPSALPYPHRLHSTDPDDQGFIDLAIARRAAWLVTRDRALLRLSRGAARHGVAVLTPAAWSIAWANRRQGA